MQNLGLILPTHALSIETLIALRGGEIQQGYLSSSADAGRQALARFELAKQLVSRSSKGQPATAEDPDLRHEVAAALGLKNAKGDAKAEKAIKDYLNGKWLEEYCWAVMARSGLFDEVYGRVRVGSLFGLPNDTGNSCSREFDVLARRGNRIIVVECKSGKVDYTNCGLGRLHVAEYLFGRLGRMVYVTMLPKAQSARGVASHMGFDVVSGADVLRLEEYLRASFDGEPPSGSAGPLPTSTHITRRTSKQEKSVEPGTPDRGTAQDRLANWCRQKGLPSPVYREVKRDGPSHARTFTIQVLVGDKVWGVGRAAKLRTARAQAALAALRFISAPHAVPTTAQVPTVPPTGEAVQHLERHCTAMGWKQPQYVICSSGPQHQMIFKVQVFIQGEMVGTGEGRRKREAKARAALNALQALTIPSFSWPQQSGTDDQPDDFRRPSDGSPNPDGKAYNRAHELTT